MKKLDKRNKSDKTFLISVLALCVISGLCACQSDNDMDSISEQTGTIVEEQTESATEEDIFIKCEINNDNYKEYIDVVKDESGLGYRIGNDYRMVNVKYDEEYILYASDPLKMIMYQDNGAPCFYAEIRNEHVVNKLHPEYYNCPLIFTAYNTELKDVSGTLIFVKKENVESYEINDDEFTRTIVLKNGQERTDYGNAINSVYPYWWKVILTEKFLRKIDISY